MIYAIDFGTSNSLLAAVENDTLHAPIPLDQSAPDPTVLRSILYFSSAKSCHFGVQAIEEYLKTDMQGRLLRSVKKFLPKRSFGGTDIFGRRVQLEQIIATFLGEMRRRANEHFQKDVTEVLLGRPALFSLDPSEDRFAQDRLSKAAKLAGFQTVHFCPEPIAAAFEFKTTLKSEKLVFVADFGGGTSDFTVIKVGPEEFQPSDVLSIGGISLAGDAYDGTIMKNKMIPHFGSEVRFQAPMGSNILGMPPHLMHRICSPAEISVLQERDTQEYFRNIQKWSLSEDDRKKIDNLFLLIHDQIGFKLFDSIENTKKLLSNMPQSEIDFQYVDLQIREPLSESEFRDFSQEITHKITQTLEETLKKAAITADQVDLVCATGGTARIPALRNFLAQTFGTSKVQEHKNFHSIVFGLLQEARRISR